MICELTPALQQFPSSLQAFPTLLLFFRVDSIYHLFPEFPQGHLKNCSKPRRWLHNSGTSQRPRDVNATAPFNTRYIYHRPVHHKSLLRLHACSMFTSSLQSQSWVCPVPKRCFALKLPQHSSTDRLHKDLGQAENCSEKFPV